LTITFGQASCPLRQHDIGNRPATNISIDRHTDAVTRKRVPRLDLSKESISFDQVGHSP
jgi:hypothetical protein